MNKIIGTLSDHNCSTNNQHESGKHQTPSRSSVCRHWLFGVMDVVKPQSSRNECGKMNSNCPRSPHVNHVMYLKYDFTQSMQCQDILNQNKKSPRQRPQPCPALKTDWFWLCSLQRYHLLSHWWSRGHVTRVRASDWWSVWSDPAPIRLCRLYTSNLAHYALYYILGYYLPT